MEGNCSTRWTRRLPFFALLGASAISNLGGVLTAVAITWFVLETTDSSIKTGMIGGAFALAGAVGALLGGPLADRLGFRRTIILANTAGSVARALLPVLYYAVGLTFWQVLTLVFLGSFLHAPASPARQSIIPALSRTAEMVIERANSAVQAIQQISLLVGAPIAGILIAAVGAINVPWFTAVAFLVSASLIAAFVNPPARHYAQRIGAARGVSGYLSNLAEGLRFINRDRLIFSIIIGVVIANLLLIPFLSVVLPVYAKQTYDSAVTLGLMLGTLGGAALLSTFLYGALGHRLPRRATFVSAIGISALQFCVLATTPSLAVAVGALAIMGFAAGPINPMIFSVIHTHSPPQMLSRVFGALLALSVASAPVGTLVVGYMLEVIGMPSVLICTFGCLLAVGLFLLVNPVFRELDKKQSGKGLPESESRAN
jgi:MFS family permease